MRRPKFTAVDLFCGAGGLSEGFKQAGFDILAANDFDKVASETFKLSHPKTQFLDGPIQNITNDDLLKASGLERGQLDALIGGPPCQAFSVYNHQRGMHDERSGLFREYLRIVDGLLPRFVVMENVTGITSVAEGRAVDEIYSNLEGLGYHVEHQILKAEQFGIPQERRRIFFLGTRESDKITWPKPTHRAPSLDEPNLLDLTAGKAKSKLLPPVTVEDAIGDLPALGITEGEEESDYTFDPSSEYQRLLRKKSNTLYNHVAPFLSEINLKRLKHIPQGGSWRDIPFELLPAGMQRAKRSDHTKRYGRLRPDGLCCTILTKCDLHWGSYIHPTQERTLTVREAARIQGFPDHIRFVGSRVDQFRQVGNAVPPLLGLAVAKAVAKMLIASQPAQV